MSYALVAASLSLFVAVSLGQPAQQRGASTPEPGSTVDLRLLNKPSTPPTTSTASTASGSTVSLSQYTIPAKARSLFEKAVHLKDHDKPDEALKKVNAALDICPKFAEALTLRGILQQNAGNPTGAAADFQQAIQVDPNYPFAYIAMAALLNSSKRFDEALPVLAEAERLAPDAWQVYFELSRANVEKRDFTSALHNLNRASELQGGPNKEAPETHLVRGYALIGLGDVPTAVHELETFLALQPNGTPADHARHVLDVLRSSTVTADR
jgi:tetratricopeptide (TPR) repeat protein